MAKPTRLLLPEYPEWLEFVSHYQGDIVRFAIEVCGYELSRQQVRLLTAFARSRSRVSVSSGHGTGKTVSLSIVALWHLLCHPLAVMLVTANDMDQSKATLWKEVGRCLERIRQGPFSWIAEHVFIGADAHCHIEGFKDQWFCESKTANSKTANKMAGRHGDWFAILADEGSTIPDEVFVTLTGALTNEHNRMLITSQYTRLSGYFHRTQTELSTERGGDWDAITLSSVDSPWVSDAWLKEKFEEYEDDEIRVRILGLSPNDSAKFLMGLRDAHAMYSRGRIIRDDELFGWLVLSDVALGEGVRDKSSIVVARVIGWGDKPPDARRVEVVQIPMFANDVKAESLPGYIVDAYSNLSNATCVIDKGGIGGVTVQSVESRGIPVHGVLWGKPCWQRDNQDRYLNLRAQASHHAARAAKEGRLSILTHDYKRQLIAQASGIPKDHTGNYRLKIPEKGSPAWEGRGSPDLWDAICFAFLEDVHYMISEGGGMAGQGIVESVMARAEGMFADVE